MVPRALKLKVQVLQKTCRALGHQSLTHSHELTISPLTLLARSILTICLSGPFLHCISTWLPHFLPSFPSENLSLATLYKTNLTFTTSQFSFLRDTYHYLNVPHICLFGFYLVTGHPHCKKVSQGFCLVCYCIPAA